MARPEAKLKELKTAELRHEVGARSELVVKVNRRSERRIIPYGEEFLFEKLPVGTRVIYPPPPLDPLADGDVLTVTWLDRLARSTSDLFNTLP